MNQSKFTLSIVVTCLIFSGCASPNTASQTRALSHQEPVVKHEYPYRNGYIWQKRGLEPQKVASTYNYCKKQQEDSFKRSNSQTIVGGAGLVGVVVGAAFSGITKNNAPEIALHNLRRCMSFAGFKTVGLSQRFVAELDSMPAEERNNRIELMMAGKI